ncbi:MerR family transcriptional regulator [Streptomyces californicus]
MRTFATRHLHRHLGAESGALNEESPRPVLLPVRTTQAVESLVGAEAVAAFVMAATEREVQARTLDGLTATHTKTGKLNRP